MGESSPVTAASGVDPAIFDLEALAAVQRLIPVERVTAYLVNLDQQFLAVVAGAAATNMEREAHMVVSQAGMLGLVRVSQSARALENAYRNGGALGPALGQCRAAIGDIRLYALPAVYAGLG